MVALIRGKILPKLVTKKYVTIHTTMTRGAERYQAHPYYGRENLARQHWAIVNKRMPKRGGSYHRTEEIPVHLQCIICLDEDPNERIQLDLNHSITKEGYYFLAHTIDRELAEEGPNDLWGPEWNYGTLAEENQTLIHCGVKKTVEYTVPATTTRGQPKVKRRDVAIPVSVGSVTRGLVGVLDPNCKETRDNFYYFVSNHNKWSELFIKSARNEMIGRKLEEMAREINPIGGNDSSEDSSEDDR